MACSACGGSKITNTTVQSRIVSQPAPVQNSGQPAGSVGGGPRIINSAPIRRTI